MKRSTKTRSNSKSKSKSTTMKRTSSKSKSKYKSSRKVNVRSNNSKWKIGDCVAPHGMYELGQHYIIKFDNGNMWGMEHNSGRYFDDIPKSTEHTGQWIKIKC